MSKSTPSEQLPPNPKGPVRDPDPKTDPKAAAAEAIAERASRMENIHQTGG